MKAVLRLGLSLVTTALICLIQMGGCVILTVPEDGNVRLPDQGKEISLKCHDPEAPSTRFRWYQVSPGTNGEEIELVGGETGDLTLDADSVADGDLLRCRDDKENKADFRMSGPRNVALFGVEPLPKALSVLEDRALNITCNIVNRSSDPDELLVQWYYWDTVDEVDEDPLNCSISGDQWIRVTEKAEKEDGAEVTEPELSLASHDGIEGSILRIIHANRLHRREYKCVVTLKVMSEGLAPKCASTFVKVKDTLAALWPFLGIVVEVIVLCAIIFMFERHVFVDDDVEEDLNSKAKSSPSKNGKSSLKHRKAEAKSNT